MTRNTNTPAPELLSDLATMAANASPGSQYEPLAVLFPAGTDACELLVACQPDDYSASRLARAVEDCNAHLVNMNLTAVRTISSELVIALRVALINPSSVIRSLERYGFRVISSYAPMGFTDENEESSRQRAAELLHILEL
ncbi:MAG: hypothetical protein K2G40_02585 [Muribaculaceae bacterium]|nr:hypothetical protein [Muribaculaceae bacterium]